MVGQGSRIGFTPPGAYPKIQIPNTGIELPWRDVTTHGKFDPDKVRENNDYLASKLSENHWYLNHVELLQGSGTRWATIVIAASDSTALSKATADYVCSGSGDATIINTAITLLESRASTTSIGRIVLLEGTYNLGSGTISMNNLGGRALHIQGMGGGTGNNSTRGATFISGTSTLISAAGSPSANGSSLQLSDLHLSNTGSAAAIIATDCPLSIDRCSIIAANTQGGIRQTSTTGSDNPSFVSNSIIYCTGSGATAVRFDGGSATDFPHFISGCFIKFTGSGVGVECVNNVNTIPSYVIVNCTITGPGITAGVGVQLDGNSIEQCVVGNNRIVGCLTGVSAAGYSHNISGNIFSVCGTGVSTSSDSQYMGVLANTFQQCTTGVAMANNAVRPTVIGNKGNNLTTAYTIAAGVTNAFVGYNDWGGVAGTDAGTGTTTPTDIPSGGAANYVLKKNSATSGDFGWALDPAIDLAAAKGDLLVGLAVDSLGPMGVERDGQILMLDSTRAFGMKWGPKVTISESAPTTPQPGDIWIDPS